MALSEESEAKDEVDIQFVTSLWLSSTSYADMATSSGLR
jgi:hypothetical protein